MTERTKAIPLYDEEKKKPKEKKNKVITAQKSEKKRKEIATTDKNIVVDANDSTPYILQVAAFHNLDNAKEFANKLYNKKYRNLKIFRLFVKGNYLYRVKIGPDTINNLVLMKDKLKKELNIKSIITKYHN